jgi:hypothetical protein
MAVVYGLVYWVWMLLWVAGLVSVIRLSRHQAHHNIWKQALRFLSINLLLFLPTTLAVAKSEIFYGVSDWLTSILPQAQCSEGAWDKRIYNRAAAMLLSTSSWLYQWLFISLWVAYDRYQHRGESSTQKSLSRLHRRDVLWGAGVITLVGGLFAIWLLWHGFQCNQNH